MKTIEQRKLHDPDNGVFGDCWRACLASILEFPYECVPAFEELKSPYVMELSVNNWLFLYGYLLRETKNKPEGYSIAVGESPRFPGVGHCCIALDGKIVFDPHADKTELNEIWFYQVIEVIYNNPLSNH